MGGGVRRASTAMNRKVAGTSVNSLRPANALIAELSGNDVSFEASSGRLTLYCRCCVKGDFTDVARLRRGERSRAVSAISFSPGLSGRREEFSMTIRFNVRLRFDSRIAWADERL